MKPKIITTIAFMCICASALAGSKSLDVLLLNIGDDIFYQTAIYEKYSVNLDSKPSIGVDKCWYRHGDGSGGIGRITKKKLPFGINKELAQKIWNGDKQAVLQAQQIMKKKDEGHTGSEGYHGMYIIKPEGDKLSIMGIGANADPKKGLSGVSQKVTDIKLDQKNPKTGAKIFEQNMCKVTKPFNIGFGV